MSSTDRTTVIRFGTMTTFNEALRILFSAVKMPMGILSSPGMLIERDEEPNMVKPSYTIVAIHESDTKRGSQSVT